MGRLVLVVVIAAAAVVVAAVIRRRRPDAPATGSGQVPLQIDRSDLPPGLETWVLLAFTSPTCASCAHVWRQAQALRRPGLSVVDADTESHRALHQRYRIDAVPLVVLIDADGVTQRWFLGPVADGDLAAAVDELVH